MHFSRCEDSGLFLGYPPEDVEGFIYRRSEAKYTGYWKVYGDVESAQRTFQRYRRCTDNYLKQASRGLEIERLTVAIWSKLQTQEKVLK